jgi:hypothetical protein
VGGLVLLLALFAGTLWFVTTSTRVNLARAVAGQAYMDICLSALSETLVKLRDSVFKDQPFEGRKIRDLLAGDYPFDAFDVEPALTRELFAKLHPKVTIGKVVVRPVSREPPGENDDLLGVIELAMKVSGTLGGATTGREVTMRLPFLVPCTVSRMGSDSGSYVSIHWGTPRIATTPVALSVKRS